MLVKCMLRLLFLGLDAICDCDELVKSGLQVEAGFCRKEVSVLALGYGVSCRKLLLCRFRVSGVCVVGGR